MRWWVYFLLFIISQLLGGAFVILCRTLYNLSIQDSVVVSLLLANVLAIVAVFVLRPARILKTSSWRRYSLLAVLMAPPITLLVNILQEQLPELPNIVDDEPFSQLLHHPLGILTLTVVGPIAEELLFRAGILGDFLRRNVDGWRAVLLSAFLFAIAHMNPIQMPVAFIVGVLLGWAYWRTGSLLAPIAIHVMNNSLAVAVGLIYDPDTKLTGVFGPTATAVVVGASIIWLGVCAYQAVSYESNNEV